MSENQKQYELLRDLVLDGRATQEEVDQLEQLVLQSSELRRDYAEHAHLNAALASHAAQPPAVMPPDIASAGSDDAQALVTPRSANRHWVGNLITLAACIAMTVVGTWYWIVAQTPDYAYILSTENCRWEQSTLPTSPNQPLGAGRLKLSDGIATLRFPLVNVTLEGPVDFEVIDDRHCRVHSGRVFANVEKGGDGFVIETPTATLTDRGTMFGVNVLDSGDSDLRVVHGEVDVAPVTQDKVVTVKKNENLRITLSGVGPIESAGESSFADTISQRPDTSFRSIQISTAIGAGDDAYISRKELPAKSCSDVALLVKRPPADAPESWGRKWQRKAFLKFDLSLLGGEEIQDATLQLYGVATGMGFASLMPDATFVVYGLTDEGQDDWTQSSIQWATSPAQDRDELDVDRSKVQLLGKFQCLQSQPTGRFEISGAALAEFLRSDTNGIATLIIIGQTVGEGEAYVHGFASRRHPELPAPTLRLRVK